MILYRKAQGGNSLETRFLPTKIIPTKKDTSNPFNVDTIQFKIPVKWGRSTINLPGRKVNDPGFKMDNSDLDKMGIDTTVTPIKLPLPKSDTLYF